MIKPTPITAYECPICSNRTFYLERDRKEAIKHVDLPKDELPVGLVYKCRMDNRDLHYHVILNPLSFDLMHRANHGEISSDREIIWDDSDLDSLYVGNFRKRFKEGGYYLLSEEEFERFVRCNKDLLKRLQYIDKLKKFVRTTPKLEEMLIKIGVKDLEKNGRLST